MKFKGETLVFYSNDIDGATSAWVYGKTDPSEDVKYIKCEDIDTYVSNFYRKCKIYFLGICPTTEFYLHLRKGNSNRVIIFNNDKSCKEEYSRFLNDPDIYFHTSQTCNQSMWKVYFSELDIPEGINYVNDALNRTNILPNSDNVIAYLDGKELTPKLIEQFVRDMGDVITQEKIVKEGMVVCKVFEDLVSEISSYHYITEIDGHKIPITCCNKFLQDKVSSMILGDYPFSCVYHIEDGQQKILLKSNSGVDVAKIAKKFGGNGIPRVANITIKRKEFFIL